jgi:hypothetical protein
MLRPRKDTPPEPEGKRKKPRVEYSNKVKAGVNSFHRNPPPKPPPKEKRERKPPTPKRDPALGRLPSSEWNRKDGGRVFWRDDIPAAVAKAIRAGLPQEDIAHVLRIDPQTLTNWKKEHPELDLAIKDALDDVRSGNIEGTLYQRAMGYKYEEEDIHYERQLVDVIDLETGTPVINPDTDEPFQRWEMVEVSRVTKRKREQPNVTAIIYWLWNRARDRWKKEPAVEISESDGFKDLVEILRKGPVKRKA